MNDLNPDQLERLAILNEECAEVQHIISKIIRHGFDSHNPNGDNDISNTELLEKEIGDVLTAIALVVDNHDVDGKEIFKHKCNKQDKIMDAKCYLHYKHKINLSHYKHKINLSNTE